MSFFFFKQNTAYDMRISDWSSDVCSSDLQAGAASFALPLLWRGARHLQPGLDGLPLDTGGGDATSLSLISPFLLERVDVYQGRVPEIGRASRRGRACQDV